MEKFQLIILGAGPAGLTAALYAARYKISTLIIGTIPGGLMTETHKICNWPGEIAISGSELSKKMLDGALASGARISYDEIINIKDQGKEFQLKGKSGKDYVSRALIFALGTAHKHLGLENEDKFIGHGLSYCATCDALFYKDGIVGVVGGGNSAITASLYLSEVAKKVHLIVRSEKLKGELVLIDELNSKKNVNIHFSTNVKALIGDEKIKAVKLDRLIENGDELALDGLFVEIGLLPRSELFKILGGQVDEFGYIIVKNDQSTNLQRIWAAGDVTTGSNNFHQIITAASEGAIAADSVFKWLTTNK